MTRRYLAVLLTVMVAGYSMAAQQAASSASTSDKRLPGPIQQIDSKLIGRKMPYYVVLPTDYGAKENSERRYPVIYLLHGLYGHFDDWPARTRLHEYAKAVDAIIVTPEGENGWYSDSVTKENDKFESYIVKELIPEIDARYRTLSRRENRAIAGLSMGGYGAIKFGLKYPEMFILVGSFSGALSAAKYTVQTRPGLAGQTIDATLGSLGGENRQANDPFFLVRQAATEKLKGLPFIYLDCGTEDYLYQSNREFADLLTEKKIPHEYRQLPGAHNWQYWDKQLPEFISVAKKFIF